MKTRYDQVPNVPKIQKAMPSKFSRPGINLVRPEKREWKDIEAVKVCIGDMVADVGQIATVMYGSSFNSNWSQLDKVHTVVLENIAGERTQYDAGHIVKAFVRVDG